MTVVTASILNYQGSNADHQTFAQGIHDLLIAAGLTQTSDTGQATISSLTRPSANNISGYEIFRFNDAEQSTLPVFLKVEYASGNSNTIPAIRFSIGQSTNGGGVLVIGAVTLTTNPLAFHTSAEVAGTSRPAFCSYGNGHLVLAYGWVPTSGRRALLILERPKSYDGSKSTAGMIGWGVGAVAGSAAFFFKIERAGSGGPTLLFSSGSMPWSYSFDHQDDVVGLDIGLVPIPLIVNGNLLYSAALAYRTTAIAVDAVESVNVFGVARNYRTTSGLTDQNDSSVALPYY